MRAKAERRAPGRGPAAAAGAAVVAVVSAVAVVAALAGAGTPARAAEVDGLVRVVYDRQRQGAPRPRTSWPRST